MWTTEGEGLNWLGGGLEGEAGGYLQGLVKSVARPGMLGFEVGGFTGWTASQVLPTIKENDGHLYFLDWFRGNVDTQVAGYHWPEFDSKKILSQVLCNFEVQSFADITTVIIGTSLDIPPICADGSLDYVYIGSDHRYTPFRDIEAWLPKVRKGGVLCGHAFVPVCAQGSDHWNTLCGEPEQDWYANGEFHFGVVRAVTEMLPGHESFAGVWSYRVP